MVNMKQVHSYCDRKNSFRWTRITLAFFVCQDNKKCQVFVEDINQDEDKSSIMFGSSNAGNGNSFFSSSTLASDIFRNLITFSVAAIPQLLTSFCVKEKIIFVPEEIRFDYKKRN